MNDINKNLVYRVRELEKCFREVALNQSIDSRNWAALAADSKVWNTTFDIIMKKFKSLNKEISDIYMALFWLTLSGSAGYFVARKRAKKLENQVKLLTERVVKLESEVDGMQPKEEMKYEDAPAVTLYGTFSTFANDKFVPYEDAEKGCKDECDLEKSKNLLKNG